MKGTKLSKLRRETVDRVEISQDGCLYIVLREAGDPGWQYIYREAKGVYWDSEVNAFKSTPLTNWSVSDWFLHILDLCKQSVSIMLVIDDDTNWAGISEDEKIAICNKLAIDC